MMKNAKKLPTVGKWYKSLSIRFKNWMLHDFWRKVIALALVVALYVFYAPRDDGEISVSVPVKLDLPEDVILCDSEPLQVSVTISGSKVRLKNLDPEDLCVHLQITPQDLESGLPGKIRISKKAVEGLNRHCKVKEVTPHEMKLNLQKRGFKEVPVRANYDEKTLDQDYQLDEIYLEPRKVKISGPEDQLAHITEIYTQPIPLGGAIKESFDYPVGLDLPAQVQAVDGDWVVAKVEIVKVFTDRTFRSVPVLIAQTPEHARKFKVSKIEPETIATTIRGSKTLMQNLQSEEITAVLNLNSIQEPGEHQIEVHPIWGKRHPGVRVQSIEPKFVTVTVVSE